MDPNNAWQAYYNRFGGQDQVGALLQPPPGLQGMVGNPATLLLAHQQLREAASQAYQSHSVSHLPPGLVQASLRGTLRAETKSSQPAFPGQPPPLAEARASQPAFPGQPPPRHSSQARPASTQPAFPGLHYPQQPSPGYQEYSPGAPSPHQAASPQDFRRELEREQRKEEERRLQEEKERKERQRIAEQRREQERVRQAEERRREQERIRQEQERLRREQEERRRREQEDRIRREQEKIRQEHERRKREEERRRAEENRRQQEEQERIRKEQERVRREQERIRVEQERHEQAKLEEQQRDLGLARLSAMGALNDLGDEQNGAGYQGNYQGDYHHGAGAQAGFNINMFNRGNLIKQEQEQKPLQLYNNWMNRANELLDLSSSDSRETPLSNDTEQQLIPQILMNPWDPQQTSMLPMVANAVQQYQQQWLSQYHQAVNDGDSFPLGKFRVLCISADEDMGFLINLPAPCNLLFQETADGKLGGKCVVSGFMVAFKKFLKEPPVEEQKRIMDLTEAPAKAPAVLPGKKAYVPPYTPKASGSTSDKVKLSSSGFSRSLVVPEVKSRKQSSPTKSGSSRSSSSASKVTSELRKSRPSKGNDNEEEELLKAIQAIPDVPLIRESSRRKAKEGASTKRKTQNDLLLDPDDPMLNNPALDLDDSDVDDDWTPAKEKEKDGRKGRGGDSSDDDFMESDMPQRGDDGKFLPMGSKGKKRSAADAGPAAKRLANGGSGDGDLDSHGPDVKVGDFLILKSEAAGDGEGKPTLWRVDGKTLIQKYECTDKEGVKYKSVNTYSGWTTATRHKYQAVRVKIVKSSGKDTLVERLPDGEPEKKEDKKAKVNNEKVISEKPTKYKTPVNIRKKSCNEEEIRNKSFEETRQFQENFEVYMQTLISQCLDTNFLTEIFSEEDDYFVSNIERVDSVTLLRKDKLLTGRDVTWTLRFTHGITTWPCLNELGPEACSATICGACEKGKAKTMLQMFGQPYNGNTLATLPPKPDAMLNRNFSVCEDCSLLCGLFHRLQHVKQTMYVMCAEIVEKRKDDNPGIDTTQILNQLLADDVWLESQFKRMQDLWADADCFVLQEP